MGKKVFTIAMALFLTVAFSFAANAAFKCQVKKVENGKVTVKCKRSDLKKSVLKTGDKLEVKKIIEGC